jgi:hypothetical protein
MVSDSTNWLVIDYHNNVKYVAHGDTLSSNIPTNHTKIHCIEKKLRDLVFRFQLRILFILFTRICMNSEGTDPAAPSEIENR